MKIEHEFKSLEEGEYTYYTIQSRVTHLSPHNKPDEPLSHVSSVLDGFGRPYLETGGDWNDGFADHIAEPWSKGGTPKYKKSHDETHDVWAKTGGSGWWTLRYAVLAMNRLIRASDDGRLNYKDGYNNITRAVRYEFRIIKVFVSKRVDLLSCADLMKALANKIEV